MKIKKFEYYVGDFETTVFKNQTYTEVWASACVKMYTEDVKIFHSIKEQFDYLISLESNICIYYHNLKFDGAFWLSFLITQLNFKQAYNQIGERDIDVSFQKESEMKNNTFKYSISDMGQWYTIIIKVNNKYIEIRDSLKLLPFSVKKIGKSFGTKHKKLDMEYEGFRYAGCEITEKEKEYIANDVLVIKEALEIMFDEGHNKLTIGSCCLSEFKSMFDKQEYKDLFPDLYEIEINKERFGCDTVGEYIRRSYRGGWCYLAKGKENQIKYNGTTADVNSLYPSMMSSESGNRYPIGTPTFWKGNYIPDIANQDDKYFFIRIRTRFYIKPNYLPFIQLKSNLMYKGTESLESSDIFDIKTGKYYSEYYDFNGELQEANVTMTMTMTDYKLFLKHYDTVNLEILDGCYFESAIGLFDRYMNKYKKIKMTSKGAKRELAKLFLNNLYGKMASSKDSSFKLAYEKEDRSISFVTVNEYNKQAGYIPIGSAITSYARNFTITASQLNYEHFIYADTDSMHCDTTPDNIKGIRVDPVDFCAWKLESCWDFAIFTRQKTYIEHITHNDLNPVEQPYYDVKCAGMPDKCKRMFISSITQEPCEDWDNLTDTEKEWCKTKRTIEDFKKGLVIDGKLMPKRIQGGIVLVNTTYEMR